MLSPFLPGCSVGRVTVLVCFILYSLLMTDISPRFRGVSVRLVSSFGELVPVLCAEIDDVSGSLPSVVSDLCGVGRVGGSTWAVRVDGFRVGTCIWVADEEDDFWSFVPVA